MYVAFAFAIIFLGFLIGYFVASKEMESLRKHDKLMAEQLALMMAQNKRILEGIENDPADWWKGD
jgi:uncharacterized protein YneF (UPF0154 family)